MRILLLEDNAIDAELTKRSLSGSIPECTIAIAPTLKVAREFVKKGTAFDLALLDINLPDGNGMDLLMEIRKSGLNMAVVMITGSGNEEVAVAALKAGADDYVVKSLDYISRLPGILDIAIHNFKKNLQLKSENIHVLYIEHTHTDVDLTARHLKQFAPFIHIDAIPTAEEALVLLTEAGSENGKYNVILMDYRLPGLNAMELIKIIRQEHKLSIPIIIVTGQGSEEIAVLMLKLGADEYVTKSKNYLYRLPSLIINCYQRNELKRKQAELTESEYKYRLLADNSGDVIFVLDVNLNYTYISPAVKSLRGFGQKEALKLKLIDVLAPESYEKAVVIFNEILTEAGENPKIPNTIRVLELEVFKKDKTTICVEIKASVIRDENNIPIGILGVTRDITDRKKASDELRKLSRAIEQSPTSVLITDTNGTIEYANPKFTELTGYSLEEIKGKNPRIFKSGYTSTTEYKNLWKAITSGNEWRGELCNKRKDSSLFWEQASISSIKNDKGQIIHFLALKEDITEKKKNEEELIKAKEKAEESDRLKSAFLTNMSHEIRTPMNGILGFSDLLKEPGLSSDEQQKYIGIIEKSGERMLNTINDLIDISKIEAGQEEIKESYINVNEQIDFLYNFFKPETSKNNIDFSFVKSLSDHAAVVHTDKL
nr:PAS domain S-box protein [Bacteroidota bacterium]